MGALTSERISCQRAFSVVGIDYAGPINIVVSRGRGRKGIKSYIALFICVSTKATYGGH